MEDDDCDLMRGRIVETSRILTFRNLSNLLNLERISPVETIEYINATNTFGVYGIYDYTKCVGGGDGGESSFCDGNSSH